MRSQNRYIAVLEIESFKQEGCLRNVAALLYL